MNTPSFKILLIYRFDVGFAFKNPAVPCPISHVEFIDFYNTNAGLESWNFLIIFAQQMIIPFQFVQLL